MACFERLLQREYETLYYALWSLQPISLYMNNCTLFFVESRFRARRVMVRWQPGSARSMPWHKNIHPTIESSWFWNVIHIRPIWKYYIDWAHIISVWKTVLTFFRRWRCCIYMLLGGGLTVRLSETRGFLFATVSRPTWRIIQHRIQWILRALAGGWIGRIVKMTTCIYLLLKLGMSGGMPPFPIRRNFWCLIKQIAKLTYSSRKSAVSSKKFIQGEFLQLSSEVRV